MPDTSKVVANVEAGKPPAAGMGRKKGVPNKTTKLLKDAILMAAENVGSNGKGKDGLVGYCTYLATDQPKAFAQLIGRVLPMQVTGPDDEDGNPTEITFRLVKPE